MTRISDFLTSGAERAARQQYEYKTHTEDVGESRSPKRMTDSAKKAQKKAAKEAGKGLKGAKAAKKTKPKKKNGLADVGSTGGTSTLAKYGDNFGKMGTYVENPNIRVDWTQYAEHAAERMQQRGMTQEMILLKTVKCFHKIMVISLLI